MATLLSDEDVGLAPGEASAPRVLSDRDVGITAPPAAVSPPANRPMTLQERAKQTFGFEDYAERGTLLPFGKTAGGDTELATPQFLKDMLESALLPGHVVQGGSYTPEDATRFSLDWLVPATSWRLPGARKPLTASRLRSVAPSTEDLKASALKSQAAATSTGAKLSSEAQNRLIGQITDVATKRRVRPGRADSIVSLLKTVKDDLGREPDVADLVQTRQFIQDAITDGSPTSRSIGMEMLDVFDDFLEQITTAPRPTDVVGGVTDDISKNLGQFRSLWSKAKKSETIEGLIENASRAASGFENGIRNEFRSLLKNPKRSRGFSEAEKKVMEQIVMGKGSNLYKLLGKFGFGLEGNRMLGGVIGTAGGSAIAGPLGAAGVPMLGAAAAGAAERATLRKALTARAMAATGQVPQNPLIMKMLENTLTRKGAGPVLGTGVKTPERQQGNPVKMPDGSTVYLDPNIL